MWHSSAVVPGGELLSSSDWDHDVTHLMPDTTYTLQVSLCATCMMQVSLGAAYAM